MKNRALSVVIFALVFIAAWLVFQKLVQPVQQPSVVRTAISTNPTSPVKTPPVAQNHSAPRVPGEITASNNPVLSAYPPNVVAKYQQGLISKDEAMQETLLSKNNESQDFYGKVIDQYGQPVISADIAGTLALLTGLDSDEKFTTYKTQSDEDGTFQFTGLTGASFGVTVKKDGYILGARGEGYKGPEGAKTSPYDRATLTMWKLRGAERLIGQSIGAKIPYDGTPATFDMTTGKENATGDLRITLTRTPLSVKRSGQGFDWAVKIEMLRGGLMVESDPYPYWAPQGGYKTSFDYNISSNALPWYSTISQDFYIQNAQGQYGRMRASVYSAVTPARFECNFLVNPSGSQNLEPSSP